MRLSWQCGLIALLVLTSGPWCGASGLEMQAPVLEDAAAAQEPAPEEPAGAAEPGAAEKLAYREEPENGAAKGMSENAEGLFIETINVNVVNVDVYVTDKAGNPVTGLTKEDFSLYEDKVEMPITNFYAVENGRPTGGEWGAEAAQDEDGPPMLPNPLRELPIPEDQRLHLIIYIDNFNIHPQNRNRVMRDLRQFLLRNLRREDRVMLATYNRSLKIERGFTSDPKVINAAMVGLEKHTGFAVSHESERRQMMDRIDDANSDFEALGQARVYADSVMNDLEFTIRALKEFVGNLAGLPGRKALLYVSDGVARVAGEEMFHYIENKFGNTSALMEAFNYDATRDFQELTALANANRVMFYTVDAGGLRTYDHVSAENRGGPGRGPGIDSIRIANLQAPLHMLADETGGRPIVNRNNVMPALTQIGEELRNYYSLGYRPLHGGDGRLYRLKVEVEGKGLRVRYRESYRDKTPEARMADTTLASLHFGFENNDMELEVEFGTAEKREDGRHYVVPITVKIPISKLTLVPQQDAQHHARLRVFVAAMDEEGRLSPVQETPVPIAIPTADLERALEQHYSYSLQLLMRRGSQEVAVGVRDEIAADSSFVRSRVRVGAG